MARSIFKYRFDLGTNPYVSDRGTESSIGARFVLPPDMSISDGAIIATGAGGTPITGTALDTASICSDSNSFTPRKVTFIRANGSSLSVVFPDRANLVATANTVATSIGAAGSAIPVVCAKLEGESIRNLIDELRTSTDAPTAGVPPLAVDTAKGVKFSGVMITYSTDVPFAVVSPQGFKMDTDVVNAGVGALPTILGTAGAACLGNLGTVSSCQGRNKTRTPRYYDLTALVTNYNGGTNDLSTTIKVPVALSDATEILTCGTDLSNLAAAICLGYKGESYNRLHRLFTGV